MGKINLQRVILGGLLAGLVLNGYDFLMYGVILKADFDAAMRAIGKTVDPSAIYQFIALDFLWGMWLMWLYAAIRPRFGPGPRTAVIAGLFAWLGMGLLHTASEAPMGIFPPRMMMIAVLSLIVALPLAAMAGGKVYSE